jgi:hypothetical protein
MIRWITNHSKTGYMPARMIQTGSIWLRVRGLPGVVRQEPDGFLCGWSRGLLCCSTIQAQSQQHWLGSVSVFKKASKELEIDSGAFVNDFLNCLIVMLHYLCNCLEGGCQVCMAAAKEKQPKFDALDKMMLDCTLILSQRGDMSVK